MESKEIRDEENEGARERENGETRQQGKDRTRDKPLKSL